MRSKKCDKTNFGVKNREQFSTQISMISDAMSQGVHIRSCANHSGIS